MLMAIGWLVNHERIAHRDAQLLRMDGAQLQADAPQLAYASERAMPLYQQHCASCHGAQLQGDRSRGAPNLADGVWLHESGQLTEIEQTILYGVRSGHPRARNLTDMPAFGRNGQLTPEEINDLVQRMLASRQQPHDAAAAERGQALFVGRANCFDCHGYTGTGISDYGAPSVMGPGSAALYGDDPASLYKSVFDGRHGLCPSWIHRLSFVEIRLLAALLYRRSHPASPPSTPANGTGAPS